MAEPPGAKSSTDIVGSATKKKEASSSHSQHSPDPDRYHGKRQMSKIVVETYRKNQDKHTIPPEVCHSDSRRIVQQPSEGDISKMSDKRKSESFDAPITFGSFDSSILLDDSQSVATTLEGKEVSENKRFDAWSRGKSDTPFPMEISFSSGNPSVELTEGILHLYKENQALSLDDPDERSEMLCMLAVPSSMTCHLLLQFLAPCSEGLQYVRIIKDKNPNEFMVLLKFVDQRAAVELYKEFNGKHFNSMEEALCHLVFVSKVECMKSSEGAYLPLPYATEMPTCHICLERMDESVDGILTILCNHTFHGSCLTKWGDTSCPVCRYSQTPESVQDNKCFECGAQESLWICLICGHVGCGRYMQTHAYRHFEETQHTYAMQLGSHRVWDYAGDNYVHRLVQSKGDGKPVEWEGDNSAAEHEEKLDSLTLEYNYLLSSQLDSQRTYFEEKIAIVEKDALLRVSEEEARSKKTLEERDRMEQELQKLSKDRVTMDKRIAQLTTKVKKLTSDLTEERQMNKCLTENQRLWEDKVAALEKKCEEMWAAKEQETKDLKEQLRDIMFYMEAQETINKTPEGTRQEIQEGQIVVEAAGQTPAGRGASKRNRKKAK